MHRLEVSRTQWASGHGFFHTGAVTASGGGPTYAYDCGSLGRYKTALEREIAEAQVRYPRIDIFYISHFDFDHVGGIPLLAKSAKIETFVIPLVTREERFLRLVGRIAKGNISDVAPISPDDFYWQLLADPEAALGSLNSAVVTVEPGVEPEERVFQSVEDPSPQDTSQAGKAAPNLGTAGQETEATVGGDIVWTWSTYVTQSVAAVGTDFVNRLLAKKLIQSASELGDPAVLANLVLLHWKTLAACYSETVKTVGKSFTRNLTSLMLYSGPVPSAGVRTYRSRDPYRERAEIGSWSPDPGWLGCGDADFRSKARREEFNRMFSTRKRRVGVFAPSHHGSPKDWNIALLSGFGPSANGSPVCVFGAAGDYGHPGREVLLELQAVGSLPVIVSQSEKSRWTERVTVYVTG